MILNFFCSLLNNTFCWHEGKSKIENVQNAKLRAQIQWNGPRRHRHHLHRRCYRRHRYRLYRRYRRHCVVYVFIVAINIVLNLTDNLLSPS